MCSLMEMHSVTCGVGYLPVTKPSSSSFFLLQLRTVDVEYQLCWVHYSIFCTPVSLRILITSFYCLCSMSLNFKIQLKWKIFLAKYKWLNRSIKKQKINLRTKTKIIVKTMAPSKCSWKLLTLHEGEMNCCKPYQKIGNDLYTLMG